MLYLGRFLNEIKGSKWGFSAVVLVSLLSGCASSDGVPRHSANQFVTVFYARVNDITPIEFESYAEEAAAMGAVEGALYNFGDDDMLGSMIFGALFSGLVVSAFEGDREGFEYGLNAMDGDYVKVTLEDFVASEGDCVVVRVSGDVNVHLADESYCINQEVAQD